MIRLRDNCHTRNMIEACNKISLSAMRKQRSIRSPRLGQDRFLSEQQPRRSPAAPWSPFTARYGLSVALDGRLRRIPDHAGPMPHPYADAEYLGARLANYKVPRLIVLDPELPRDESGKLFKRKIKAQYWHQTSRV